MILRSGLAGTERVFLRMKTTASGGNHVDCASQVHEPAKSVEGAENGWLASSFELSHGLRVCEVPMDTLPGEVLDEFFT